jgi:hypothetical protein
MFFILTFPLDIISKRKVKIKKHIKAECQDKKTYQSGMARLKKHIKAESQNKKT